MTDAAQALIDYAMAVDAVWRDRERQSLHELSMAMNRLHECVVAFRSTIGTLNEDPRQAHTEGGPAMTIRVEVRSYQGPLRPEPVTQPGLCYTCRKELSREDKARRGWYCERCADPDGYLARLRASSRLQAQRLLEAYPVCAGCGQALNLASIQAGETRHPRQDCGGHEPRWHRSTSRYS